MGRSSLSRWKSLRPLTERSGLWLSLLGTVLLAMGCAHYPVNEEVKKLDSTGGYAMKNVKPAGNSGSTVVILSFSGGGTRAAALSYGVLEELARTEVEMEGKKGRLLDQVDLISAVSGGSFTAGYYGLFGDRIFQDFESKFLKRNIQGALAARTLLNPINWFRLSSSDFDRSDLAAEYYDKYVFEGGTFGDMASRKGPVVSINATEMTHGVRFGFDQDVFNVICSDLSKFPVARAAAASSAVPMLLSPVSLRNYAGTCDFKPSEEMLERLKNRQLSERQFYLANNLTPFLDSKRKPYIHLVDGGVADNLGLRAILDRIILRGSLWETIKGSALENVQKVVFIIVNAETQPDTKWDRVPSPPPFGAMLSCYSSIAIERYNEETIALLKESLKSWMDEVKTKRCKGEKVTAEPGSCGDLESYLVEVKFDALKDEEERTYFKRLPTSFVLKSEQVDKLRDAAHRIMVESSEFQRLLKDLRP